MTSATELCDAFGPDYDIEGAMLKKFRSSKILTREERQAYGDAVEKAVLSRQKSELRRLLEPERKSPSASGTWHSDGEKISQAIREQQHRELLSYPAEVRRKRHPTVWWKMYQQAMKEKRARDLKSTK